MQGQNTSRYEDVVQRINNRPGQHYPLDRYRRNNFAVPITKVLPHVLGCHFLSRSLHSQFLACPRSWIESVDTRAQATQYKLESELSGYKTNLIKESIRMGHHELADFFYARGDLQVLSDCSCTTASEDQLQSTVQKVSDERAHTYGFPYGHLASPYTVCLCCRVRLRAMCGRETTARHPSRSSTCAWQSSSVP